MSQANVVSYLSEQKQTSDKELAKEWEIMEEFYNEKLWNELTIKLSSFVKNPKIQNEKALMQLYSNFISTFETKINPFGLVEILSVIIAHMKDKKEAIAFIEKLKDKVKICDEAVWMCKVLQGQIYLEFLDDKEATKKIIEDLKDILEEAGNVTPVHGKYYLLASAYYRLIGQHADYYRCSLQFLGCSIESFPKSEWPDQAFFLGLAALLGEGVYNIGELLAHPIIDSLRGTENEWLIELLHAFNSGDIAKFEEMKPIWSSINDLKVQEVKLRQKISLLCLMEMTFKRAANNRTITFTEIANETRLPLKEVELLIMKALAQGLVRGAIDQVAGVVNMTWVQPRVLNRDQVSNMAKTLDTWIQSITSMEQLIETRAAEILTN
ncbi:CLUMA_CG001694, isoform A [Clunio marinus]|uniref:26S proteasome non-ATPase regulatory subunit 13 n=1 Tax=Clunio marinus TaxID=568069 RepID=A0A1J1HJ12_9DIPT|nr:CLUMA_CG001694, isoform A [Clunio marinus]